MARRDDLYKEFIAAASKAYGEAIVSNEPNVQELVALYAMISRMRVQSPPQTVACAEKSCGQQSTPTLHLVKTICEFHELVQSGSIWNRSAQGLQRSRARGVAGIHNAVTLYRAELSTSLGALRSPAMSAWP